MEVLKHMHAAVEICENFHILFSESQPSRETGTIKVRVESSDLKRISISLYP